MKLRGVEENTRSLFTPDFVLPSQYNPPRVPQTPCHKLLSAIFDDGIGQLLTTHSTHGVRVNRLWNESVSWILSDDTQWGSFVFCCQHLGYEEGEIRKKLGGRFPLVLREVPPRVVNSHEKAPPRLPVSYPDVTAKAFRRKRLYVVFADGTACWVISHNLTDNNTVWRPGDKGTLVVSWRASRAIARYARAG